MRTPWANLVLLILLIIQVVTGYFGFVNGRSPQRWILWLHGIGAYGLLVLLYWKSSIIADAFRRKNKWTWSRLSFAIMLVLLLITIALGLVWTYWGPLYLGGFSLVSLHIYLAIPLMILLLWHSWRMRFILKLPQTLGRRLFLGGAVSALGGLFFWRAAKWTKQAAALPGAERRFTGSYEWVGNYFPSVSWIADRPEPVEIGDWRLEIGGAVMQPLSLNYGQLQEMATDEITATLDCTGGWYTTQDWRGVSLGRLLALAGVGDEAKSMTVTAVSGYQRRFSLEQANGYLLALAVAGDPLSHGHGFPVRLVAPDQRGVNWVKWVARICVNETSRFWQLPLPLQ
jgi:hypothetical protein